MTDIVDDLAKFNGKWPYEQARLELVSLRNERDTLQDSVISRDMTIESLRQRVKELEALVAEWNQPVPLSEWQKMEAELAEAR